MWMRVLGAPVLGRGVEGEGEGEGGVLPKR